MKVKFNVFVFIIILLSQNFNILRTIAEQGAVNRVFKFEDQITKASSLSELGLQQYRGGMLKEALQTFMEELKIRKSFNDPIANSRLLNNLGLVYSGLGEQSKALVYYNEALALMRAIGSRVNESRTLNNIGFAYSALGDQYEALKYYNQALPITKEMQDREGEASTLGNIGLAYRYLGETQKALEYYNQSLLLSKAIQDRQGVARTLTNLGGLYSDIGEQQKALGYFEEALPLLKLIRDRAGETSTLNNIGAAYSFLGQKQKALEYYNQSLLLSNSIQDRHTEARTLNNIGSVYSSLGEKQKALEAYSQALLVYQALEDRPGEAITLDNIGGVYIFLNENQKAFDFFDQALSLFRAIKDPRGEATTLVNIGYSYSSIGSNQKALDYYLSALPLYKIVQDPRGEATVLNNIGTIYESLGSQEKALDYFSDALPIFQAIGDRQGEANTLKNLGETTSAQNRPQLAIFLLKQSVNTVQSLRKDIDKLPKSIQRTYAKSQSESYRILAKYLLEQGRILEAEQVLDLLKIEELDDYFKGNFRGNKIQRNVDYLRPEQEILNLYNSHQQSAVVLGQELSKLENLSKSGVSLTPAQEKRKAELDSLLTDIKSQFNKFIYSPEVQKLTDQLTRADQQQISLDVFDKLRTNLRLSHSKAVLIYPLILDDRLEMIITTPDTPPLRRVVNVKRAELLKAIVDYRDILRNPSLDAKPLAKKLYAWLIAPLETDLVAANAKTILYAPDGPLRYIPLAALYDGTQWLAQKYAVNNITSVSISDLNARPRPILKVLAGAFADKNLIYKIQVGQQPPFSLHGLPFAGQEVEAVAATVSNTNKLVDQAFSLRATKPRFREYNILHFATHYLFFPGKPEESFLLFGDGERASLGSINDWSLSNVDLVVLSGCETGVGIDAFSQKPNPDKSKLGNGIEFLGLGYQFQASGAGAVIASLWPVNDGGTERLMSAFYTSLSKDNTKAEALRQAQVALITGQFKSQAGINNLSHPYYWAPFFLIGNGL